MKKRLLALGLILTLIMSLAACNGNKQETAGKEKKLRDVTVILDYVPNTNHTGLYAAKELGFYKKQD
ncbi:hypothetical protein [Aminipila terrae]|uniref:hypothetical protein n=1 Tax=Aminipila terrae TaxID=2697030 RepID=UPI002ED13557